MNELKCSSSGSPFFSIVVPTYNRLSMLMTAIESIKRQTFRDFEVVIVNDGSTYGIEDVSRFMNGCAWRYVEMDSNKGAAAARNMGINHSNGKYISFLDDDDEFEMDFLRETRKLIDSDALDFCWSSVVIRCSKYPNELVRYRDFRNVYTSKVEKYENMMSIGIGFGVTINAEILRRIGGFDVSYSIIEDSELILRLVCQDIKAGVIRGRQVKLNDHSSHRLTSSDNNDCRIRECKRLIHEYAIILDYYPSLKLQLERQIESLRKEAKDNLVSNYLITSRGIS